MLLKIKRNRFISPEKKLKWSETTAQKQQIYLNETICVSSKIFYLFVGNMLAYSNISITLDWDTLT